MKKKLIIVGGSKGGVGKSIVSTAVIDLLRQRGEKLLVIDSDTSNPDVFKSHHKTLECLTLDLDRNDGWMALLNAAYNTDATVVINSAARNNHGIDTFGSLLMTALSELDRALTTLWVINRQRDSLLLLRQYRQTIKGATHVVRNLHAGGPTQFELFNGSKLQAEIEAEGGRVIDFPDLADRVADAMSNERLAVAEADASLPFGERIELKRWRSEATYALSAVL